MARRGTNPGLAPLTIVSAETDGAAFVSGGTSPRTESVERDRNLVARAAAGNMQAWSRLYHDHFDAVYSHVCYLTGDAVLAEDLVQDVFARALTHARTFDGRATFLSWTRGIALNVVRMHWRRAGTTSRVHRDFEQLAAMSDATTTMPDRALVQEQRMQMLYEVLAAVPETLREAFLLCEIEGVDHKDAATQLEISTNNLAVRLTRARTRIKKELTRRGWLPRGAA